MHDGTTRGACMLQCSSNVCQFCDALLAFLRGLCKLLWLCHQYMRIAVAHLCTNCCQLGANNQFAGVNYDYEFVGPASIGSFWGVVWPRLARLAYVWEFAVPGAYFSSHVPCYLSGMSLMRLLGPSAMWWRIRT